MFKRHYIAFIFVVLAVLIIFNLPSQTLANFKLAVGSLFLPLFGLAGSTSQVAETSGNALLPRRELLRQNAQLHRENQQLKLRASQTEELLRENAQLRQLVGWQRQNPGKYKLGRILARDPANWWRTAQIDLGSRDGIRPNLPVRTMDGLIGRITTVAATRSQVILLGDPNLRVGALIRDTGDTGIIFAGSSSPIENNMVDLGYLARTSGVRPGQTVMTSGDGGLFPKGIPIGNVVDVRVADDGLSTEARVQLAAKMNALEEVWVILP